MYYNSNQILTHPDFSRNIRLNKADSLLFALRVCGIPYLCDIYLPLSLPHPWILPKTCPFNQSLYFTRKFEFNPGTLGMNIRKIYL